MPNSYPEVRRSRVALTVTLLFVGTIGVLAATADMGFARDEGFYFRYGRDYARWFARVERASDTEAVHAALARDAVVGTWIGNFEHPPLMKSAFASAWRHLSRKDREVSLEARPGADGRLLGRVQRVESADGFEVGAEVVLLAPLAQGVSQADPSRATAVGTVVERAAGVPIVAFTTEDPLRLRALCAPTQVGARHGGAQQGEAQQGEVQQGGGPSAAAGVPITRCQVRERRLLGVTGEASAMRWVAFVVTALAVILTFLLGLELFGYDAGLCGALLFLFVPRHFYHAHLLTFDMAIVAATLATLYAFWRSLADRRWAVAAGVAWGLALLTKHNAFFIPVPLTLWWLWSHRADLALGRVGWRPTLSLPALPVALLVMPAVALPMLFVFWPKLWFDPFRAVQEYFAFHL